MGSTAAAHSHGKCHAKFTLASKMCHDISLSLDTALLCTQAVLMAHFAGRREIGVKFPMRAASVDPKSTQLTALTISSADVVFIIGFFCCDFSKNLSKRPSWTPGTPLEQEHLASTKLVEKCQFEVGDKISFFVRRSSLDVGLVNLCYLISPTSSNEHLKTSQTVVCRWLKPTSTLCD